MTLLHYNTGTKYSHRALLRSSSRCCHEANFEIGDGYIYFDASEQVNANMNKANVHFTYLFCSLNSSVRKSLPTSYDVSKPNSFRDCNASFRSKVTSV